MLVEDFPPKEICQKIAAEINLSKTAFVKELGPDHFHIRWFTPKTEVQLCGHATLASAHILHEQHKVLGGELLFESLIGPLKVYGKKGSRTLDFPLHETFSIEPFENGSSFFEKVVGYAQGVVELIVELESEKEVRKFIPCFEKLLVLNYRAVILTARACGPYDFVSRFFAPRVGINEDPVTGSAHCKLAHYWQGKLNKNSFKAYQAFYRGKEMALEIHGKRVYIGGEAVTLLEGDWKASLNE
jgi:PhzF family phenazine biosynthesis protein